MSGTLTDWTRKILYTRSVSHYKTNVAVFVPETDPPLSLPGDLPLDTMTPSPRSYPQFTYEPDFFFFF